MPILNADMLATFRGLLDDARKAGDPEPTAMTLATVDSAGQPSLRTVLLKAVDTDGFVFYTNTHSRKGEQLLGNPHLALLFFWKTLPGQVQVKVEGIAQPVSDAEADAYFATRPRQSQIGAWASLQSQTLDSRATFEQRIADYEREFAGGDVPRPPHWSGYRVQPQHIEFWYGAQFRLHERHVHDWVDGAWQHKMLYP